MSTPLYEITLVFAAEPDEASRLLELLSDICCRETGGHGYDDNHVCGGFICASLGPATTDDQCTIARRSAGDKAAPRQGGRRLMGFRGKGSVRIPPSKNAGKLAVVIG